jgi:hypothetical protein
MLKNATLRWSEAKQEFLHMWEYNNPRVIDSGGYNVQADVLKGGGPLPRRLDWYLHSEGAPIYPFSVKKYHDWLTENSGEFDWAAVMDYACEERFDPLWSVTDRIEATIHNTIKQFDMLSGEYDLLPVLQGRCLDDYLYCYDRLKEVGIPVERCGLGTVCRISSSDEIVDLEHQLRERREFEHIHGFGVKIEAYKMGASFESADSQAWVWHASHGEEYRDGGHRLESLYVQPSVYPELGRSHCSLRRTVTSFREYYRYVSRLRGEESALPPLEDDHTTPTEAEVKAKDPEEIVADGGSEQ